MSFSESGRFQSPIGRRVRRVFFLISYTRSGMNFLFSRIFRIFRENFSFNYSLLSWSGKISIQELFSRLLEIFTRTLMTLVFAHQRHQILKCFVIESPESFPCGIFFTLRRNTFSKDFEILRFFSIMVSLKHFHEVLEEQQNEH